MAVLALHIATDLLGGLERRFYDFASRHSDRDPSDRIAIIAIDDQSIANIGRWPWPRAWHTRTSTCWAAAATTLPASARRIMSVQRWPC